MIWMARRDPSTSSNAPVRGCGTLENCGEPAHLAPDLLQWETPVTLYSDAEAALDSSTLYYQTGVFRLGNARMTSATRASPIALIGRLASRNFEPCRSRLMIACLSTYEGFWCERL